MQKRFSIKPSLETRIYVNFVNNKVFFYKSAEEMMNPDIRPYLIMSIKEYKEGKWKKRQNK